MSTDNPSNPAGAPDNAAPAAAASAAAGVAAPPAAAPAATSGVDAAGAATLPKASNLLADAKADGDKKPDAAADKDAKADGDKKPDAAAADLKPEDYKLKLPDGVAPDDPGIKAFTEAAAKHKLTPEAAQGLYDEMRPQIEALQRQPYEAWKTLQETWQSDIQKDPEIGGAKLADAVGRCARLMDRFGDANLREALELTGAGNHPSVVRFLNKVALAVGTDEGKIVQGNPALPPKSAAQKLYPDGWQNQRVGQQISS